jgi:hypothetical protein
MKNERKEELFRIDFYYRICFIADSLWRLTVLLKRWQFHWLEQFHFGMVGLLVVALVG